MISKGLFGFFNSSKKQTKKILNYYDTYLRLKTPKSPEIDCYLEPLNFDERMTYSKESKGCHFYNEEWHFVYDNSRHLTSFCIRKCGTWCHNSKESLQSKEKAADVQLLERKPLLLHTMYDVRTLGLVSDLMIVL